MEGTLITTGQTGQEKTISSKDHLFSTNAEQVLVIRKGALHWRGVNEVGDGMELVVGYSRETIDVELDPQSIESGMGVYQEFDEDKNETISYLYRFGNDEESVEIVNDLLQEFGIENQVVTEGKFTKFVSPIGEMGATSDYAHHISFLLGVLLVYGRFIGDEESIFHGSIELPMVGSIAQHEELLASIVSSLKLVGIYVRAAYTTHRSSQVWSAGIYDWELLSLMKYAFGDERVIAKQESAEHYLSACNEMSGKNYEFIKTFGV